MTLIRLGLVAFAIFSIATASSQDQAAMYNGARAFAHAAFSACTRPDSPCTSVLSHVRALPSQFGDDRPATRYPTSDYVEPLEPRARAFHMQSVQTRY